MSTEELVRSATLQRLGQKWPKDSGSLIVEEFGCHRGAARIDIAVVNGALHGYELKSSKDTLDRLPGQVTAFSAVFDYLTVVAATKHLERALDRVPPWWGVMEAAENAYGVRLTERRRPKRNPAPDPFAVACLMWREEVLALLELHGWDHGVRSAPKLALVDRLVVEMPPAELGQATRSVLKARRGWRDDEARLQRGDSFRRARMSSDFLARRIR